MSDKRTWRKSDLIFIRRVIKDETFSSWWKGKGFVERIDQYHYD